MPSQKIKTIKALAVLLAKKKQAGKRIVFTNGCFDILHAGHVMYLQKAKRLGDLLVVAVNSDASVRKIKGCRRPINTQKDRTAVLSALKCVDYIAIFGEKTPEKIIKALKPNIIVKGADWKKSAIVGKKIVESYGGKVVTIPLLKGRSTSGVIKRMRKP